MKCAISTRKVFPKLYARTKTTIGHDIDIIALTSSSMKVNQFINASFHL